MTIDKDFKKKVRERMARTGERYTTARAAILKGLPEPPPRPAEPRYGFPKKQPW